MAISLSNSNDSSTQLYREAISTLEQLAHQTAMKDNMDYLYIDTLYQRCKQQINELQKTNSNPHIAASLESLLGTLDFQESTLKSRHRQRMISEPSLNHPMDEHGHRNRHCSERVSGHRRNSRSSINEGSDDEESSARQQAVEDMMITPDQMDSDATLDSVAGLEEAKQILQEAVVMPAHYPQLFQNGTKPWTRMLLYGPPGTGKTRLAKALANELKCTFFCVSPASLLSCLIGESEKLIRDLFKTARNESGQSVIFFDEIDSLCRRRTQNEDEHTRRVKTELLRQIEGIENSGDSKVFLLGATNCPWDLDNAFLRRFQRRIYTPLPDRESRQAIISHHLNSLELTESEWSQLLDATDGYSGADISHMTMAASFQPIRELHTNRFWTFTSNNKIMPCSSDTLGAMQYTFSSLPPAQVMSRSVKLSDFITAAKSTPRTVSQEMLFKYEEYHQAPYQ